MPKKEKNEVIGWCRFSSLGGIIPIPRYKSLQKEVLKNTEFSNATFKTIQNKIIKTAAWVKEMKTKIKIELPRCCPTKDVQSNSLEMFSIMRV